MALLLRLGCMRRAWCMPAQRGHPAIANPALWLLRYAGCAAEPMDACDNVTRTVRSRANAGTIVEAFKCAEELMRDAMEWHGGAVSLMMRAPDQLCWHRKCWFRPPLALNGCHGAQPYHPAPLPQPPALPFGSCLATSCATLAARSAS